MLSHVSVWRKVRFWLLWLLPLLRAVTVLSSTCVENSRHVQYVCDMLLWDIVDHSWTLNSPKLHSNRNRVFHRWQAKKSKEESVKMESGTWNLIWHLPSFLEPSRRTVPIFTEPRANTASAWLKLEPGLWTPNLHTFQAFPYRLQLGPTHQPELQTKPNPTPFA